MRDRRIVYAGLCDDSLEPRDSVNGRPPNAGNPFAPDGNRRVFSRVRSNREGAERAWIAERGDRTRERSRRTDQPFIVTG
jgi:hypothetical protein